MVTYVILDIEHPRQGLIRIDALDQALVDLRSSMKQRGQCEVAAGGTAA